MFSPLQVGPVTLRNRIALPPLSTYYSGTGRFVSERLIAYYRERALGGVGLITTEQHIGVSGTLFRSNCLTAFEPEAVPGLAAAGEAVHEHGAKLFVEILAPGAWDFCDRSLDDWHVSRGPSAMYVEHEGSYVAAMSAADIRRNVADLAATARNVLTAGLDGVTIHGAHGYLPQQFMSPVLNRRTDAYGGSAANRVRFNIEAGEAIREAVGDALALGIRLSIDERKGGAGVEESAVLEMVDIMVDAGVFDFFDVSIGGLGLHHLTVAPMSVEEGFLLPQGKAVKQVVGGRAKVFIVGKIRRLAMAEQALADGAGDVVGMGRALLADPHLVRKTLEGRAGEVARCIGAAACSAQPMTNCQLNPTTGRELRWGGLAVDRAASSRRVLVVGGGPAGLRLAGTAAARGHDVVLVERDDELGGHLNEIKLLPTRGDWQMAIDDLVYRATRHGVEMRLGVEATPLLVASEDRDVVVVAAGARWPTSGYSWLPADIGGVRPGGPRVVDVGQAARQAAADPKAFGRRVLVVASSGGYLPLGLAELLAGGGAELEVISQRPTVTDGVLFDDIPLLMSRLARLGVRWHGDTRIVSVEDGVVVLADVFGGEPWGERQVDTIVLALPKQPRNALYDALVPSAEAPQVERGEANGDGPEVHVIGDALAPRHLRVSIYEGEKLAREL